MSDWLEEKDPNAGQRNADIERAKLFYEAFQTNAAGKKIYEAWLESMIQERVPTNSSPDVYARAEAKRDFILRIRDQINIAKRMG